MDTASGSMRRWVVAMTVSAVPVALLFELGIAQWMLPPEMSEFRVLLGSSLTMLSWMLFALTFLTAVLGLAVQPVIARRLARTQTPKAKSEADADLGAFILAASLVQLPAIAAGLMHLFGAALKPALFSGGLATVVVVVQALRIERR